MSQCVHTLSFDDVYDKYVSLRSSTNSAAKLEFDQLEQEILGTYIFKNIYINIDRRNEYGLDDSMCIPANLFDIFKRYGPRKVCQYQFKRNDIVWICKECQKDETCVLCNECFQLSNHDGHEVYFYHSTSGGCCDCGDVGAWSEQGFCSKHGISHQDPLSYVPSLVVVNTVPVIKRLVEDLVSFIYEYVQPFNEIPSFISSISNTSTHEMGTVTNVESNAGLSALVDNENQPSKSVTDHSFSSIQKVIKKQEESYCLVLHMDDVHRLTDFIHALMDLVDISHEVAEEYVQELSKKSYLHFEILADGDVQLPHANDETSSTKKLTKENSLLILLQFRSKGYNAAIMSTSTIRRNMSVFFIIQMLFKLAQTNDGICHLITSHLSSSSWSSPSTDASTSADVVASELYSMAWSRKLLHSKSKLDILIKYDPQINNDLAGKLHDLYLTLMADQSFKVQIAQYYAINYLFFGQLYQSGVGLNDNCVWSLSVQFLNRHVFVYELATKYQFLDKICLLLQNMLTEGLKQRREFNSNNSADHMYGGDNSCLTFILSNRRYHVVVGDMKIIFSLPEISRLFLSAVLDRYLSILTLCQYVHPQRRELRFHVEYESREWVDAFNVSIGLASMFDMLFSWIAQCTTYDETFDSTNTASANAAAAANANVDMDQCVDNKLNSNHEANDMAATLDSLSANAAAGSGGGTTTDGLFHFTSPNALSSSLFIFDHNNNSNNNNNVSSSNCDSINDSLMNFGDAIKTTTSSADTTTTAAAAGSASDDQLRSAHTHQQELPYPMTDPSTGVSYSLPPIHVKTLFQRTFLALCTWQRKFSDDLYYDHYHNQSISDSHTDMDTDTNTNTVFSSNSNSNSNNSPYTLPGSGGSGTSRMSDAQLLTQPLLMKRKKLTKKNKTLMFESFDISGEAKEREELRGKGEGVVTADEERMSTRRRKVGKLPKFLHGDISGSSSDGDGDGERDRDRDSRSNSRCMSEEDSDEEQGFVDLTRSRSRSRLIPRRAAAAAAHWYEPIGPPGTVCALDPPDYSFHLPLHRFLAAMVLEVVKHPQYLSLVDSILTTIGSAGRTCNAMTMQSASSSVSSSTNAADDDASVHVFSFAELPIRSLVFGAQVQSSMWTKNGSSMADQYINYGEASLCRIARDLDLFLLQLCMTSVCSSDHAISSGRDRSGGSHDFNSFLILLLYHFDLLPVFTQPQPAVPVPVSGEGLFDIHSSAVAAESAVQSTLLEEFLLLLIQIFTELPLPCYQEQLDASSATTVDDILSAGAGVAESKPVSIPKTCTSDPASASVGQTMTASLVERSKILLRREVIHKLASSPSSYSQLQEVFPCVSDFTKIPTGDIDKVIFDVSIQRGDSINAATGSEAPKRVLKPESWREYDPSFYHMTFSSHQIAYENRPKVTKPAPIVQPPLPCHLAFVRLRSTFLFSDVIYRMLQTLTLSAAAQRVTSLKEYDAVRAWKLEKASKLTVFTRVLHLLTLMIHTILQETETQTETERIQMQSDAKCSGGRGIGSMAKFAEFLLQDTTYLCTNQAVALDGRLSSTPSSSSADNTTSRHDSSSSSSNSTVVARLPCVLGALLEIHSSLTNDVSEANLSMWLQWVIQTCGVLSPTCKHFIDQRFSDINEETKRVELETRKKRARERAMKAMQSSAQSFSTHVNKAKSSNKTSTAASADAVDTNQETTNSISNKLASLSRKSAQTGKSEVKGDSDVDEEDFSDTNNDDDADDNDDRYDDDGASSNAQIPDCIICQSKSKQTTNVGVSAAEVAAAAAAQSRIAHMLNSGNHPGNMYKDWVDKDGELGTCMTANDSSSDTRVATVSDDLVGHLCFTQLSSVLYNHSLPTLLHVSTGAGDDIINIDTEKATVNASPSSKSIQRFRPSRLHLGFCGHSVHLSCLNSYIKAEYSKSELQSGLLLDQKRRQFLCPLCKQICNSVIPHYENKAMKWSNMSTRNMLKHKHQHHQHSTTQQPIAFTVLPSFLESLGLSSSSSSLSLSSANTGQWVTDESSCAVVGQRQQPHNTSVKLIRNKPPPFASSLHIESVSQWHQQQQQPHHALPSSSSSSSSTFMDRGFSFEHPFGVSSSSGTAAAAAVSRGDGGARMDTERGSGGSLGAVSGSIYADHFWINVLKRACEPVEHASAAAKKAAAASRKLQSRKSLRMAWNEVRVSPLFADSALSRYTVLMASAVVHSIQCFLTAHVSDGIDTVLFPPPAAAAAAGAHPAAVLTSVIGNQFTQVMSRLSAVVTAMSASLLECDLLSEGSLQFLLQLFDPYPKSQSSFFSGSTSTAGNSGVPAASGVSNNQCLPLLSQALPEIACVHVATSMAHTSRQLSVQQQFDKSTPLNSHRDDSPPYQYGSSGSSSSRGHVEGSSPLQQQQQQESQQLIDGIRTHRQFLFENIRTLALAALTQLVLAELVDLADCCFQSSSSTDTSAGTGTGDDDATRATATAGADGTGGPQQTMDASAAAENSYYNRIISSSTTTTSSSNSSSSKDDRTEEKKESSSDSESSDSSSSQQYGFFVVLVNEVTRRLLPANNQWLNDSRLRSKFFFTLNLSATATTNVNATTTHDGNADEQSATRHGYHSAETTHSSSTRQHQQQQQQQTEFVSLSCLFRSVSQYRLLNVLSRWTGVLRCLVTLLHISVGLDDVNAAFIHLPCIDTSIVQIIDPSLLDVDVRNSIVGCISSSSTSSSSSSTSSSSSSSSSELGTVPEALLRAVGLLELFVLSPSSSSSSASSSGITGGGGSGSGDDDINLPRQSLSHSRIHSKHEEGAERLGNAVVEAFIAPWMTEFVCFTQAMQQSSQQERENIAIAHTLKQVMRPILSLSDEYAMGGVTGEADGSHWHWTDAADQDFEEEEHEEEEYVDEDAEEQQEEGEEETELNITPVHIVDTLTVDDAVSASSSTLMAVVSSAPSAAAAASSHTGHRGSVYDLTDSSRRSGLLQFLPTGLLTMCHGQQQQPRLIDLPTSYTQFHGMVFSLDRELLGEYPGVCLVCGAVMDAAGKGLCTKHVKSCSGDSGIIYLLQDHKTLLVHGDRSVYHAGMYVDDYGESYRYHRGKPLLLSADRYKALKEMFVNHKIATEVAYKRSTATRVVILNYY